MNGTEEKQAPSASRDSLTGVKYEAMDTTHGARMALFEEAVIYNLTLALTKMVEGIREDNAELDAILKKAFGVCDCEFAVDPETGHNTGELINLCYNCEMRSRLEDTQVTDAQLDELLKGNPR